MRSPAVSVCMPVYNASRYLRECIDSILAQTFTDFELLIVDDGSTDDSKDIVRSYNDRRIRLIYNRHNYIESLNILLREARGKYIARMDADDKMRLDRLHVQYNYMENNSRIDILGAGLQCFGDDNTLYPPRCIGEVGYMELMECCGLYHPTAFIRKKSIDAEDIRYRKQYVYAEDYAFWAEAVEKGLVIVNIKDILLDYRLSSSQITFTKKDVQHEHSVQIREKLVKSWFLYVQRYLGDTIPVKASERVLTIIIPFYNEGEELRRTVASIRDTADSLVDIIVVNDKSDDGVNYEQMLASMDVTFVNTPYRMGPAMSKEKGIQCCGTKYFILLDAHMRFYRPGWVGEIVAELSANPNQILCCQTKTLKVVDGVVKEEVNAPTYGAFIYMGGRRHTPMSLWNSNPHIKTLRSGHIPCVLGASYASSKNYWNKLGGYRGLLCYGCEEPYISLKAWLEGGKCKFLPDIVIGHVYKDYSTISLMSAKYTYNFLFIAYLLFPTSLRCKTEAVVRSLNIDYYEKARILLKASEDYRNALKKELSAVLINKNFEDIKSINYVLHPNAEINLEVMLQDLPTIVDFCQKQKLNTQNIGLFSGRIGLALLFMLYFRNTGEIRWKYKALYLINEVRRYFMGCPSYTYSFSSGISGVGWGLLFLVENGFVPYEDVRGILGRIDSQIVTLAPTRINDFSLENGYTGVVAYCTARIGFCRKNKIEIDFPEDFMKELIVASKKCCQEEKYSLDVYSYSLHSLASSLEEEDWNTMRTDFIDIMDLPTHLTKNEKYWEVNMKSGCLGYAVNLLITKYKLDENK